MKTINYKDTLLMPATDFSMKANLTEKEPVFQQQWIDQEIYQKVLARNKDNQSFLLHDGPPYANGNLHIGHALNKVLKDIIVRRKNMEGFYAPYVPGWDTHGLPIENKMLEKLAKVAEDFDPLELRKHAAKYALEQVENQKSQFQKMNLFSDFKTKYVTLEASYEAKQLELFKKMCLDGLVYKGLKPIYWSPSSKSALAEAEVEYHDHMSPQIIVAFTINKGNDDLQVGDKLLIMTTTPWTLIANAGVAVGQDIDYDIVSANEQKYVVASALTKEVVAKAKWENFKVLKTIKGQKLVDLFYEHPLATNQECPVVLGHHVSVEEGTGLVHIAPLFGEDDYIIGKKYDLKMIMHVEDDGLLNKDAGHFAGQFYADANKDIGMKLDEDNKLLSLKFIKHSYPHDWRTNKPIIYRGVPQWFVNIKSIKEDIVGQVKKITTYPSWGQNRLLKMMENRDEWTISRQRTWGVPIIIFYDQDGNPQYNQQLFDYVIDLVQKEGTNVWWSRSTDELLPEAYRNLNYTREKDIMDVWFDSGTSFMAADFVGQTPPYDLYLEGSDQYRGWFNSSLINGVAYMQKSPYRQLVSHGFVVDGKQNKMSKSKGNVVDPLEVINKQGADVLRLWVANSDYTSDVSFSQEILKQDIEIYRRIRNTFKFMLGNLQDFDIVNNKAKLMNIHQYIYDQTIVYSQKMQTYYDQYKFQDVVQETNKFLVDLSAWYFNQAKDTLYCDSQNNIERRSVQTNIYYVVQHVLQALAPIMPVTTEEIYRFFNKENKQESLFLEKVKINNNDIKLDDFALRFMNQYRKKANKVLEAAIKDGMIKRSNEAILTMGVDLADQKIIAEKQMARYLMVAKVIYGKDYSAQAFTSTKCLRCWNHFKEQDLNIDTICLRCQKAI